MDSFSRAWPPAHVRKSLDVRYDLKELKDACMLINTADYCQTTALEVNPRMPSDLQRSSDHIFIA